MSDHLHLSLRSDPAAIAGTRKLVEAFAQSHGMNEVAVGEIGLCVNEALANVIRHAYAGRTDQPIELDAHSDAQRVTIEIRDWGSGVTPSLTGEKTDPHTPGGLGLPCLKTMTDGLTFVPQPDGMLLRMFKHKSPT